MTMTKKQEGKERSFIFTVLFIVILIGAFIFIFSKRSDAMDLMAPGKNWNSPKKVEDYFVEKMNMTAQQAQEVRNAPGSDGKVTLRVNDSTTLDAIVGNLFYYGFIKDENKFKQVLETTKDTTPTDRAIAVGKKGTIEVNAEYRISEGMSSYEIANVLLNKPSGYFPYDEYGYFFMP